MGCLKIKLMPEQKAAATVTPSGRPNVVVTPGRLPSVAVTPGMVATAAVTPEAGPVAVVTPRPQARITIGSVCVVSGGELLVLASTEGPLRTCDGGYLLLDPALET